MVISEGQQRVLDALEQKTKKAMELYENLVASANRDFSFTAKEFDKKVIIPGFLK